MSDFPKTIRRILPTFTDEPALVGELVEIDGVATQNTRGQVLGKLLGDSEYIRENTDGYVSIRIDEMERVK